MGHRPGKYHVISQQVYHLVGLAGFSGGKPVKHKFKSLGEIPATSPESDAMSKDLRARGFKFVGSTICYAFMQASGMVNDHLVSCPRYEEVQGAE